MDNVEKYKYRRLYNKMVVIKNKTIGLNASISNFEEELKQTLLINNKPYKSNEVNEIKNTAKEVQKSIRYQVLNHIRNYL